MFEFKQYFKDFDNHRAVSLINDPKTKLQGFISIHRGNGDKIPAFGATRFSEYRSPVDALADSLRLSRLMSYKSAMAGLKYGGAKGVIIKPKQSFNKKALLNSYCEKVNLLAGHFITGADVGISAEEVKAMRQKSDFIVGVKTDPVKYTVLGLLKALEVTLEEMYGSNDYKNRTFAIQGVGKIGSSILEKIYSDAKKIFVSDIDNAQLKKIKKRYPTVEITSPQDIFLVKTDILMPCALGNALNTKTISKIKASVILGGANNQLANASVGELLFKLGVLYAPDYVVNAGGLISVVDEYENKNISEKRIENRLTRIPSVLKLIIQKSKKLGRATNVVADQMAEAIFNKH